MKKLLFLFIVATAFTSCRVTFNPPKEQAQLQRVIMVDQGVSDMYFQMSISPDKSYTTYSPAYIRNGLIMDSIVSFDQERAKGKKMFFQSKTMRDMFYKFKAEHEARGNLTEDEVIIYREFMKSVIRPVLKSESSLK